MVCWAYLNGGHGFRPQSEKLVYRMIYFNPILIAAAVIPAIVLLVKVEKADRLEKESRRLLVSLVVFGIVATAIASLGERIGMALLESPV